MNRLALITGATSGIGQATARIFADNNIDLIICGRRRERLQQLARELEKKVRVHCLSFDISKRGEVDQAFGQLPEEFRQIDILINNAGNAHGLDSTENADIEDWERMLDINVKGLMYVSKKVIPGMCKRNGGHIINVSSIAGKEVYPLGNGYCASKFAVDALTKAMRMDLIGYQIKVASINPGLVETEFSKVRFKGDDQRAKKVYQGFVPLSGDDVGDAILFMITRPKQVNIADLTIFPTAQASSTLVHRESN